MQYIIYFFLSTKLSYFYNTVGVIFTIIELIPWQSSLEL